MKNIFATLLLTLSLGVASTVNAQTEQYSVENNSTKEDVTRVCYNSTVEVINKDGKENKEGKIKYKENCFEFSEDGTIIMTDQRGKTKVFEVTSYQLINNDDEYAYLVGAKIGKEEYQMVIDYGLGYIGIHKEGKNKGKTNWYFTTL